MTWLSYPADYWCPRCQIHLRSQDAFDFDPGNTLTRIRLMPLCPVCQDDDNQAKRHHETIAARAAAVSTSPAEPIARYYANARRRTAGTP